MTSRWGKGMTSTSGAKVLVLEDDVVINLDYCLLFEDMGHETLSCYRIEEAFDALEHEQISFALLDHRLEGRTSEEVRAHLRNRKIPFIIVSGSPEEEFSSMDRRHLHQKPVPRETIEAALECRGRFPQRARPAARSQAKKHSVRA